MNFSKRTIEAGNDAEKKLFDYFSAIDEISLHNQNKVLAAFQKNKVALWHFSQSTGYGYDDKGRETLNKLFADIFNTESALVSPHILSGTHALSLVLFGILRPGDLLLSITGNPYDTLIDVINKENSGSLKDFNIGYSQIELKNNDFDFLEIEKQIKIKIPKMVFIQRSRGYSNRNPIGVNKLKKVIDFIKNINDNIIIFVDNCYGEFTEKSEPTDVGSDIVAGSLIKNPGGGIAPNGGYIAGKTGLINLTANRLTTPSTGNEIGSYALGYQYFYQGLFLAPHVTAQSLKGALFLNAMMNKLNFKVSKINGDCFDIINSIQFNTEAELIEFCRCVQYASPVDSFATLYPWEMPGYSDKVIMAAGCFVQGSSIELSCDAPIRPPYVAYCQGGLTYEHVKLAALYCYEKFNKAAD